MYVYTSFQLPDIYIFPLFFLQDLIIQYLSENLLNKSDDADYKLNMQLPFDINSVKGLDPDEDITAWTQSSCKI